MGRDSNFCCITCGVNYYLGSGSYSTWLDHITTIEEYRKQPNDYKSLGKNQRFFMCLTEHQGHNFIVWNSDFADENQYGALMDEDSESIIISDYSLFNQIDLEGIDFDGGPQRVNVQITCYAHELVTATAIKESLTSALNGAIVEVNHLL